MFRCLRAMCACVHGRLVCPNWCVGCYYVAKENDTPVVGGACLSCAVLVRVEKTRESTKDARREIDVLSAVSGGFAQQVRTKITAFHNGHLGTGGRDVLVRASKVFPFQRKRDRQKVSGLV